MNAPEDVDLPEVSVVIPTAGRRAQVLGAIGAVLPQNPHEVVVVVNGDDDGTLDAIEALNASDPRVRPVRTTGRGQFPALQVGTEQATGEVVLCLDDDVMALPGLVEGHARQHADHRNLVVLGYMPIQRSPRRPGQVASYLYSDHYEALCRGFEADPRTILLDFWAGNFSIRRDLALSLSIGGPDTPLPYHADKEFGFRCLEAGVEPRFVRELAAVHHHSRTVDEFVRESSNRARGAVALHESHPAVVEMPDPRTYGAKLPAPGRWIVRRCQGPRASAVVTVVTRGVVWAAGQARWYRMESFAASVLMNVIEVRTLLEAAPVN